MRNDTLSVIIPNYNHAHYLEGALSSVLSQSFRPLEVIVVDDGSTDDSVTIIERFASQDPIVRLLQNRQNKGVVFSVNRALKLVSGDYVYFQSADDKVLPGFFEKSMNLLAHYPQAGLCCSDPAWLNEHTGTVSVSRLGWSDKPHYLSPDELADVIRGGFIAGHTSIVKRSALLDAGGFIPELKWHCDWFAVLVIGFRHGICYVPEPLASLRVRSDSLSSSGRRDWSQQKAVLSHLLRLLRSPDYQDVVPYFVRGSIMSHFGDEIVRVVMNDPEHLSEATLMLIREPLRRWNTRVQEARREKVQQSAGEKVHTTLERGNAAVARDRPPGRGTARPKISVITPSYNCARYIRGCIESILAQHYANFEHIIVDGGSQDGTVEILKAYPHLKWISEPDHGEADALNKALRMVDGDIIGWLNADDCYFGEDVFRMVAAEIDPRKRCHAVYGKTLIVDERDRIQGLRRSTTPLTFHNLLRWFNRLDLYQPSIFYSKELVHDVGLYRTDLKYGIDLDYWLRAAIKGYRFQYIDRVLSTMKLFRAQGKTSDPFEVKEKDWLQVCAAYLHHLSRQEQIGFWRDYYFFRLSFKDPVPAPLDQYAMTGLLLTLQNTGRLRSALPWLSEVAMNYPDVVDIQLLLAEALGNGGQTSEAAKTYERALALEMGRRRSVSIARSGHEKDDRGRETARTARSLRVLFVNRPDALAIPGGDTTHMLRLKAGLERLGVRVDVCCELEPDPAGYDLINLFNLLIPGIALRQAAALRRATGAPIILTPFYWDRSESLWGETAVPSAIAAATNSEQLTEVLRQIAGGTLALSGLSRTSHNRPYAMYEEEQGRILQDVDHLIAISAGEERLLTHTFADRIARWPGSSVIPTGVDIPSALSSPDPFIGRFGIRDFVLITGRVEPRKNQLMLLLALRDAGLPVVVAGAQLRPSYLELCRKAAPEGTQFVGRLDEALLASARAAARVHALPSWWECAGIASMEAALAGCNVVMGDRGAESEYFGDAAYYCDPADIESIRRAVCDAYHHYESDRHRRQALQTRLRDQHNWDRIAARTLEVYRTVSEAHVVSAPSAVAAPASHDPVEVGAAREAATMSSRRFASADSGDAPTPPAWPQSVVTLVQQADNCLRAGDLASSLQAVQDALAILPHEVQLIVTLGNLLLRNGNVEGARREFVKATVLRPDYAPAHVDLAAVLLHLGRSVDAEASARRALEWDATNIGALKVLARVCLDTERYQEAVQAYATILEHAPDDLETLILVGNCYAEVGRFDQARAFYRKALTCDPSNEIAKENLAKIDRPTTSVASDAGPGTINDGTSEGCSSASVVVVTYNSVTTIRACLDSVLGESRPATELIVVDNASTDGTQAILEDYRDRITVVRNRKNLGFSAACNQGVRASMGHYVVLLNPDTVVTPGWLDRMIAHFGPGVGAIGPVSDYVAGLQKYQLYHAEPPVDRTIEAIAGRMAQANSGRAVETKLLIGFCLMAPRTVLDEIGLLDEDLFLGNDDLDLSWRLRHKGYRLAIATDVFVHHEGQVSFGSEPGGKTARLVQESTDRLYAKLEAHYGQGHVPDPMELWGINWFKPTPRAPHRAPRVSIVILTHNGLEHTKKCLASIETHTPESHELIIVDNASNDGTYDYLRDYMAARNHVVVVANRINRGFAAGNNQGLVLARGEYILLLNNDTVVTDGWLGRMLNVFDRHPEVGIVGPVSNYVSGAQCIKDARYASPAEMRTFAARWAADHAGQSRPMTRVVGFCLLARKAVIDRIGGLDERFGSGNFEDDDFCIRAAQVGFSARIAVDVFIHHTGSQTFKAAGIDYRKSMERNWGLFRAKWGLPADAPVERGYRLPLRLADGSDLCVPLPDLQASHTPGSDERWWAERQGAKETRYGPCTVVVHVQQGHPQLLWPSLSLTLTANPPREVIAVGEDGVLDGAAADLPEGWGIMKACGTSPTRLLNQVLQADGVDPVVLLSTDLMLTEGWLERLREIMAADPTLAIVAPTSGLAPRPQRVRPRYEGMGKGLRRFARHRRQAGKGRLRQTDYLGGFCLVLHRRHCRSVGGLREDLTLADALWDLFGRLRAAGYRLAVALDVYVHHDAFGAEEGGRYDELAHAALGAQEAYEGSLAVAAGL